MTKRKKHPGGRPPAIGETRDRRIEVRVTAEERERAQALADAHDVDLAEWVRRRATTTGAER